MNAIKLIVLVIIIFVLSQLNQWSVLDKVFFALVGILAIAMLWSRFSLVGLALTRDTRTDRAQVGQPLVERVRIENRSKLSKLWVEVIDHSDLPGHRSRASSTSAPMTQAAGGSKPSAPVAAGSASGHSPCVAATPSVCSPTSRPSPTPASCSFIPPPSTSAPSPCRSASCPAAPPSNAAHLS